MMIYLGWPVAEYLCASQDQADSCWLGNSTPSSDHAKRLQSGDKYAELGTDRPKTRSDIENSEINHRISNSHWLSTNDPGTDGPW